MRTSRACWAMVWVALTLRAAVADASLATTSGRRSAAQCSTMLGLTSLHVRVSDNDQTHLLT